MNLIIREAVPSDFDDVNVLMNQVHAFHRDNRPDIYQATDQPLPEKAFVDMLSSEAAIVLVAEVQKAVVAVCMVSIRNPSKNPIHIPRKVAYMDTLCVHEEHRKQGIGRRIFHEMVKRVKERGISSLELTVWPFNEVAIGFYRQLGMRTKHLTLEMDLE